MDPLSITFGLLTIVTTTVEVVAFAKNRLEKARRDKKAAGELLDQLKALQSSLEALEKLLRSHSLQPFSSTSALATNTRSCEDKLRSLCQELKEAEKTRSRFQWPLSPQNHGDTLQELRDMVQWIQFAVSIDGMTILSKTSNEVIEILSHQLQTLHLIHKFNQRTETSYRVVVDIKDTLAASDAIQHRSNVLGWLSKISQQEKHNNVRSLHTHGTGQWLLQDPIFQQWKHRPTGHQTVLWCHGPPGSGKTVLISEIIEHLRADEEAGVAYIYFDYRAHMHWSFEEMTAILLKQLASARSELPSALNDFYHDFKAGSSTAQRGPLLKTLSLTSKAFTSTFVVIDALDECDAYTLNGFLQLVGSLQTCSRVLVASRDFQRSISNVFRTSPQIKINAHSSDIRSYILDALSTSSEFWNIDHALENEIADKITQSSQHMFLLATFHLEKVLAAPTRGAMADALDSLPESLTKAFSETMKRIKSQTQECKNIALHCLRWMAYAKSPFTAEALSNALAMRKGQPTARSDYRPSLPTILDCSLHHAAEAGYVAVIQQLLNFGLDPNIQNHGGRTPLCCAARSKHYEAIREGTALQVVVRSNPSPDVVRLLLEFDADPNIPVLTGKPLLHEVALHQTGHEVLRLLLQHGADVNLPFRDGLTALQLAASHNKLHSMRILLESGANVNAEAYGGYTALHAAALRAGLDAVELLLQYDAILELPGTKIKTPLHLAAKEDRTEIVHILLKAGADLKACMKSDGTPLDIFLKNDDKATYDLLMEWGAKQESAVFSAETSLTAKVPIEEDVSSGA
ncbi:MAG: hypothetical protein Q9183_003055 [Haloplaca sp. 2 TL-2023]